MNPDKALETMQSIVEQRDQARFERDVVKARAIQLRLALLWARERVVHCTAEELYSLDAILAETKGLEG